MDITQDCCHNCKAVPGCVYGYITDPAPHFEQDKPKCYEINKQGLVVEKQNVGFHVYVSEQCKCDPKNKFDCVKGTNAYGPAPTGREICVVPPGESDRTQHRCNYSCTGEHGDDDSLCEFGEVCNAGYCRTGKVNRCSYLNLPGTASCKFHGDICAPVPGMNPTLPDIEPLEPHERFNGICRRHRYLPDGSSEPHNNPIRNTAYYLQNEYKHLLGRPAAQPVTAAEKEKVGLPIPAKSHLTRPMNKRNKRTKKWFH